MVLHLFFLLALPILVLYFIAPRKSRAPPGPHGLPFIGNLHQIDTSNTPLSLWKLSKEYGPLMSMKLGSKPLLVISSAKMAENAMKTHDLAFGGRSQVNSLKKLSYNFKDLSFAPMNEHWKEMRKICLHQLFSAKQVQSFRPFREDEVSRMMTQISSHASKHEVVNLSDMMMSLTNNLICRVAYGKRCNEEDKRGFNELLREYVTLLGGSFFFSDYLPLLGWIDNITGLNAKVEKTMNEFDSFFEELIEENLNLNRSSETATEETVLSLLLQLREEKSSPVELTLDHIKGLLVDIFTAGTDTSATTIVWAMTMLMKMPETMEKVQAEIWGLGKTKYLLTEDDIQTLPYFKAIIKEILRFYPPTPLLLPRETTESCVIDGYEIKQKTLVFINAWAVSRDTEYWENPLEFLPERFLDSKIDYKGQNFGFIPFGAGRRGCPGITLGMVIVELALANLLNSFVWELPPGMKKEDVDIDVSPGIVMPKKIPLCLVPTKRHN